MCCQNNENTNCGCTDQSACGCKTKASEIVYQGPNLPCTGIETCTPMDQVIKKFDEFACGDELVQTVITNILNNPTLLQQLVTIINNNLNCNVILQCTNTTSTTTTSTTTLVPNNCGCIEITTNPEDIANATGNTNPAVNGLIFIGGPKDVLCDGGSLPPYYDTDDSFKYCVEADSMSSVTLFYYKNDGIITNPDILSTVTILEQDCSETGTCIE